MYPFKCICVYGLLLITVQYVTATGHCVYNGSPISKGGALTAPRGSCFMMACDEDGKLSRIDCHQAKPQPDCHRSGYDMTKIYPQCCPFDVCPNDIDYEEIELKT